MSIKDILKKAIKEGIKKGNVAKVVIVAIGSEISKKLFGVDILHPVDEAVDSAVDEVGEIPDRIRDRQRQDQYALQLHQTLRGPNAPVAHVGSNVFCPQHGMTVITSGACTTNVASAPVARQGDLTSCGAVIIGASGKYAVEGRRVAKVGDLTSHFGVILDGTATCKTG
jgi:uncharacterized Zn-binding protein involved in type VI secretion